MSITEKTAVKIGNKAKTILNADSDEVEIIIYGAINLIQIINAILWVTILGFFTGTLYESLLFSFTASILRKYSGGVHASSPMRCAVIGAITAVSSGIFIDRIFYKADLKTVILFSIGAIIASLVIIIKNAPVDSIQKPISDAKTKKLFKKKSIILVFINTFIVISLFLISQRYFKQVCIESIESISMGMLCQSITLTKFGICLITKVDFGLKYIFKGGE